MICLYLRMRKIVLCCSVIILNCRSNKKNSNTTPLPHPPVPTDQHCTLILTYLVRKRNICAKLYNMLKLKSIWSEILGYSDSRAEPLEHIEDVVTTPLLADLLTIFLLEIGRLFQQQTFRFQLYVLVPLYTLLIFFLIESIISTGRSQ